MASGDADALEPFVSALGLTASQRDAVLRAARQGPALPVALAAEPPPSALHALLAREPPEALALALALGAPAEPVRRFLTDLRGVRLEISGQDLLDAGVQPSEALGRALDETLRRKLDGRLSGRDEELQAALELARGGA
jgi:tRNA nucleotidyltransferase (CCA-adding enzyme)